MLLSACIEPQARVQSPSPSPPPSPAARLASAEVARQVRRCYRSPRIASVGRGIVIRLLVRYDPDGLLAGLPVLVGQQGVTPENQAYAGRVTEAAKLAVIRCSPIRLRAGLGKRRPSEFYLTFSRQMSA